MDEPEFEGGSFPRFVVAGATAGMMEHLLLFPVDTIKVYSHWLVFFRFHFPRRICKRCVAICLSIAVCLRLLGTSSKQTDSLGSFVE